MMDRCKDRILYVTTSPPPRFAGADAAYQDVHTLQQHFGGHIVHAYPGEKPSRWLPPALMGVHLAPAYQKLKASCDLIHVFVPLLKPLPFFEHMGKPMVYTVLTSIAAGRPGRRGWNRQPHIAACLDPRDTRQHIPNFETAFIPPAAAQPVEASAPPALDQTLTLLIASAPWTKAQFKTKGIDLLLQMVANEPGLKLIVLWRDLHTERLKSMIQQLHLNDRVEVINKPVDVGRLLKRVHASVVLAANDHTIKAYPHSLLESLLAGRPVMVSNTIAMAADVQEQGFGVCVENLDLESLRKALRHLRSRYSHLAEAAKQNAPRLYTQSAMLKAYAELYDSLK